MEVVGGGRNHATVVPPLIAALFSTIEHAMLPQPGRHNPGRYDRDREVTEVSGLGMVELQQRLRTFDGDGAALDALGITTERFRLLLLLICSGVDRVAE